VAKARIDEHELKVNMLMRNQDYLKNAMGNGMAMMGANRMQGGNEQVSLQ
jgi:hypothetical protein